MIVLAPDSRGITWDRSSGGSGSDVHFLNEALRHVFGQCRIDASRIALGGFSDGASYALSVGLVNGDLFTHVVGYSPGNYWRAMPRAGRPPIFLAHGFRDTVLDYDYTRQQIVRELGEAGYEVTFVTFAGGHTVPGEISEAALDWFLSGIVPPSVFPRSGTR
jgi:phospholipase/carboxylesterase